MYFINKHDTYVEELKNMISSRYDSLSTNMHFQISRKSEAEMDIVARKGNRIDIYEVKCSYRLAKAKQQLKRAKRILKATNTYFYCGSSKNLQNIIFE